MKTVTVTKKFDFHAAHRLPHHDGQCRRLHGHTYGLAVSVTGPINDKVGASDEGMVLDFTQLKDLYKMLIEPHVEHQELNKTLASEALEIAYPMWTDREATEVEKCFTIREPLTTAEGLACWILQTFQYGLYKLLGLSDLHYRVHVEVWETPSSSVRVGSEWRDSSGEA